MGFYTVLSEIERLLAQRGWRLRRCRRQGDDNLRYFIIDADHGIVTPVSPHRRLGLTLPELLLWMEQTGDPELAAAVQTLRIEIGQTEHKAQTHFPISSNSQL